MQANEKQIGGNHYASKYQAWDFIIDLRLHYLYGCALKYIYRHKKKNGVEDVKKAEHYIEKAKEIGIKGGGLENQNLIKKFIQENEITHDEALIIHDICYGKCEAALKGIRKLIKKLIDGQNPYGTQKHEKR